jgi:hypothetical protein
MAGLAQSIYDTVTAVGQCIVDELVATGGGLPGRVCLLVPGEIAQDGCDCGQFAQTILPMYPSDVFPTPSRGSNDPGCGPPYLVVPVKAQVARCIAGPNDLGDPPTCAALAADALTWLKDGAAMRKGAGCCLTAMYKAHPPTVAFFSIGQIVPVGPQGLCMAAELTYSVAFNSCTCPG